MELRNITFLIGGKGLKIYSSFFCSIVFASPALPIDSFSDSFSESVFSSFFSFSSSSAEKPNSLTLDLSTG